MLSKIRFSSLLIFMCFGTLLIAQPWAARHGLNGAQYQAAFSDLGSKGFYPTVISGYVLNNQAAYAAIWEKKNIPASEFRHGLSGAQYQAVFSNLTQQGFRPAFINGFAVNGQDYYNAIFEKTGGPEYIARHGISAADYQKVFDEAKGFRPKIISAFTVNGQARFAGVWIKDNSVAWVARHNLNPQQYQTEFNKWTQQGYKVACISGYTVNGQEMYAAVWEKQNGPLWAARHGIQGKFYQYEFDNFYYQGYRPRFINAYNVGNQDKFAGVWDNGNISGADMQKIDQAIQGYMSTNNVPGISIAFCKAGRLVFAKSYGQAVKATGEPASPNHLFRIASVSKPLTALAIMKLVEQGKVKLTDKVFGANGILNTYTIPNTNPQVANITVSHLLHHSSGFSNTQGDPAFIKYELSHSQLIQWVINNEIISNTPGTVNSYNNFGYIVLGRIIEKKSGQTYEQFVRSNITSPAGANNMRIGANSEAGKANNEVTYHPSSQGSAPYNLRLDRMDGNGGWIASAIDLARVLVRYDGNGSKPDLLQASSINALRVGDASTNNYGLGYVIVNGGGKMHNGAMPGTNALMHDTGDGGGWSMVLNTRAEVDNFAWTLQGTLGDLYKTINWPSYDLF